MERMAEVEVSLRLAMWLADHDLTATQIDIAIDGAQVRIGDRVHFDVRAFLAPHGWNHSGDGAEWRGGYTRQTCAASLRVHSTSGCGDVVAMLRSGQRLRAECKKGPLSRSASSQEYPLLHEALGQVITVERVESGDIFAVAVPYSETFEMLASRWRNVPMIKSLGIQILTVATDGEVVGFAA